MSSCAICLLQTEDAEYHSACIETLFGTSHLPRLNVNIQELYALAAKMAGKMSISGVQEKVSLTLSKDKRSLDVTASGGTYILKPEPHRFSSVPQIEHLTMRLASLTSIEVPPFGLMKLSDGALAYVIKRFDRPEDGTKLQVEDFCQLSERRIKDKYQGSAELCVRLLRKHASEPLIEIRKLYNLLLFGWWVGNSDLHLKNISLLTTRDGIRRLSPAYDLVSTRLVLPEDGDIVKSCVWPDLMATSLVDSNTGSSSLFPFVHDGRLLGTSLPSA